MKEQSLPADHGGEAGKKPMDDRDNPIIQSATTIDTSGDSPMNGTPPRPPFDGPPGGGGDDDNDQ